MYKEYNPISKKTDSSTYVPPELYEAQQQGIKKIPIHLKKRWDDWVAEELGISVELLWDAYSSEQIDSIGICIINFEKKKNFFIGDETGIGKGRILSGISRWAWNKGKKVLFFTEREHLISEFWKDLYHTHNISSIVNPISYHSKSKVFNLEGVVELKGNKKLIDSISDNGFDSDTNLVMTNYSQISFKQHKEKKLHHLKKYCENAILIMDECHNATGDSNTKDILIQLKDTTIGTVFSSATYLKDESQLDLYESSFDLDKSTMKVLRKTLRNDQTDTLRKIFTYELTKNLQFWRREHQPLEDAYHTLFCENDEYNHSIIETYSKVINGLFNIVNTINQDPSVESNITTNSWFALGATINRLSRNLLLVLKLNTLIESVKQQISENRKAVIVLDSTLSSLVQKISSKNLEEIDEDQDELDELPKQNIKFNFQTAIVFIINEVLGEALKSPFVHPDIIKAHQQLLDLTNVFSELSLSPIDTLLHSFQEVGIACGEISGRTFCLDKDGQIQKLVKEPKTKIVSRFNNGESDVVIITRAGASGISLHASAAFKDKKVRVLYELEITNRPTYRLQFRGRVNRKNQVEKPFFFLVVTRLPFEQRILNVEQRKLQKLQSHISGDTDKTEQSAIFNFYNNHTEQAAYVFLKNHKHLAYQMGISLKGSKEDYFYVDSLLKRCIVLPVETQNFLYDYLIYSVNSFNKLQLRQNTPNSIKMNNIKTFWHQMSDEQIQDFQRKFKDYIELSINQFQFPWVGLMEINSTYKTKAVSEYQLNIDLNKNLEQQPTIINTLQKVSSFVSSSGQYSKEYTQQQIIPRLKKLKIGNNIIISNPEGKIFGYIHNIMFPELNDKHKYPDLALIHVKTINPHLHSSVFYAPEDYYFTLVELIESDNIEFSEKPIDWTKFTRPLKSYDRVNHCFVGHPVYMQFLHQCYQLGEIEYFNIGTYSHMCVLLPPSFSQQYYLQMKKPIFEAQKAIDGFMQKRIGSLTTVWQGDDIIKPYFRIERTDGGFMFKIAEEVYKNAEIVDFPLKKKLADFRGRNNGFCYYFLKYKELPPILHMMEKREVVWFIEPYVAPPKKKYY